MNEQATHDFAQTEASDAAMAEGVKVKRPTISAVQQRADVKSHLITAMIESLDYCPHGDHGRKIAELTIQRFEVREKVNATGKRLSDAEVWTLQESIPGTNANKALRKRQAN
jgi:hypothetical protein